MSIDFQESNVLLAAVQAVAKNDLEKRVQKADDSRRFALMLGLDEDEELDLEALPEFLRDLSAFNNGMSLDPAVFMQQLYGPEFDPVTGRVNHAAFLQETQAKTAHLTESLTQALTGAGIVVEDPLVLTVNRLGQVQANRAFPAGDEVDALMIENWDLAQAFRDVVQAQHWAALTEVGSNFVNSWYGTADFQQRVEIADRFHALFDRMAACCSTMTFEDGVLNSASVAVALDGINEEKALQAQAEVITPERRPDISPATAAASYAHRALRVRPSAGKPVKAPTAPAAPAAKTSIPAPAAKTPVSAPAAQSSVSPPPADGTVATGTPPVVPAQSAPATTAIPAPETKTVGTVAAGEASPQGPAAQSAQAPVSAPAPSAPALPKPSKEPLAKTTASDGKGREAAA